ncbi:MAG TPA: energy transducer TonB [Longimicrobiales bacterium]|nr:energy transducer TonB [Longimicrobiales bacterium]
MTAAVARPPLFSHLVASRPDRDSGSMLATLLSVVLHALVIIPLVLLSARTVAPPQERVYPFILEAPLAPPADVARQQGGGPVGGSPVPAPPAVDLPMPPDIIPDRLPPRGLPLGERPDLFRDVPAPSRSVPGGPGRTGTGENPTDFVPITVVPELLNRVEIARMLERLYPVQFQQAGIGGTVVVWLRLDESGAVMEARIKRGSGHGALDDAALRIARSARFSPAFNRDVRVKVWVELPVIFGVR